MLNRLDKDLKSAIVNMFKELKENMSKELIILMSHQIENINKQILIIFLKEPNRNSGGENYNK